jgi:hypothetical protein
VIVGNPYVALAGGIAQVYSVGLAGWDEEADLRERFGAAWLQYRQRVGKWIPRWRPAYDDAVVGTLYVASECHLCQQVARWFRIRGARGLAIRPAETYPQPLTRITYESADGGYSASGIRAIARGLEHIHLGWAMLGFALRLPVVADVVQLIVDASGGGPRQMPRTQCQERPQISPVHMD